MKSRICVASLMFLSLVATGARADVQVLVGPTPIRSADAMAAGDITLANEKLAVALAVQSRMPYGVPRGGIIDVAPVVDGQFGRDQVEFADFIPNAWSAWPNSYQRVEIIERGPQKAIVRAERDWGKVVITTEYTLEAGKDYVVIRATMRNDGDAPQRDLRSGLTLWPNVGYVFPVPGLADVEEGAADAALSDRVVAYDEGWFIALHAPYFDRIESSSRDLFRKHSLAPGESRGFEGWLQVGPSGDLAPVLRAEIDRKQLTSGVIRGTVTTRAGAPVEQPIVVIEKLRAPYAWAYGRQGRYELTLPVGDYTLYATAKSYASSPPISVSIKAGDELVHDFRGLGTPARVRFDVRDRQTGKPLDARIAITQGEKPLVEFLGKKVFFTQLDSQGVADEAIAPGNYVFSVSSGGGFLGPTESVSLEVLPGRTLDRKVLLTRRFDPRARGWYSADLHHHADQAEANTPPAEVARSQLAAGLDLLFVSDHDTTINFPKMQEIARRRGVSFIPGIELSPSWGHFNAYPLQLDARLSVDTSLATVQEILADGRRMGAITIQANHPYIPYGYLTSAAAGVVPGGFSRGFDLMEINVGSPADDPKVLAQLAQYWNAHERVFLSAGSDTHDVWNSESGRVRVYAHPDGSPTPAAFAQALNSGRAYVSFGPLVYPSVMFGDTLRVRSHEAFTLGFDLQSTAGTCRVELVSRGEVVRTENFEEEGNQEVRVEFPLTADAATWYALVVRDRAGRNAYSNPIWVDVDDSR